MVGVTSTTIATEIDDVHEQDIDHDSPREIFSLKADPTALPLPHGENENSTESGCCCGLAVLCCLNSTKYWGGGTRTPTPVSHHVGVSGGGSNHRLTPSWWEQARGVVADV